MCSWFPISMAGACYRRRLGFDRPAEFTVVLRASASCKRDPEELQVIQRRSGAAQKLAHLHRKEMQILGGLLTFWLSPAG